MVFSTSFGTVEVMTGSGHEGRTVLCQQDTAAYANIVCTQRVRMIQLAINVAPNNPDAQVFVVRHNQFRDERGMQSLLTVPVKWNGDDPKTRERGMDNVDIIILLPDGRFIDVQCGVITRRRAFFITAQRVWEGQVVRTRGEANKVTWGFVPTQPIHAYPNATYDGVWSTLAESVMEKAHSIGASDQKSRAKAAAWNPPALASANGGGWRAGIVHYFNMITGTGQIEDADGVKYFVHFNNILDPKTVPMLDAMSTILFRPDDNSAHIRQGIKSVRSVRIL